MKAKMESLGMPALKKNIFTEELPGNHNKKNSAKRKCRFGKHVKTIDPLLSGCPFITPKE